MKKQIFMMLAMLLPLAKANCQLTKGNWLVGGNASFSYFKNTQSLGNTTIVNTTIAPNMGYFLIDKLAGGLRLNFSFQDYKQTSLGSNQSYALGPFVRYYFLSTDKIVNIVSEASYQYRIDNPSKEKSNSYAFLAGPVVYFNSSVGLEFTAGYSVGKSKSNDIRQFQLGLGLQIHLEKEK